MLPRILITGGCRSGKSAYAQQLAERFAPERLYLATAYPHDAEMRERIRLHQAARGEGWRVYEVPPGEGGRLWERLGDLCRPGEPLLFDCLTLWAAGQMQGDRAPDDFPATCDRLLTRLLALPCPVLLVNNEVGMGIVPESVAGRAFRDMAGLLGAKAAQAVSTVILTIAGLPLVLKGALPGRSAAATRLSPDSGDGL